MKITKDIEELIDNHSKTLTEAGWPYGWKSWLTDALVHEVYPPSCDSGCEWHGHNAIDSILIKINRHDLIENMPKLEMDEMNKLRGLNPYKTKPMKKEELENRIKALEAEVKRLAERPEPEPAMPLELYKRIVSIEDKIEGAAYIESHRTKEYAAWRQNNRSAHKELERRICKLEDQLKPEPEPEPRPEPELIPWNFDKWHAAPDQWQPITREGIEVKQLTYFDLHKGDYELAGINGEQLSTWIINGRFTASTSRLRNDITHMRRVSP